MKTPVYSITLDGKELAGALSPYLSSLSLSESREDDADTVRLTLDDSKGKLALPSRGQVLRVSFGWSDIGLVDKGTFTVTEVEHRGAPDVLTIQARSASMTKAMVERKEKSWHATTLGAIITTIANAHGLKPAVSASLAAVTIPHIDQTNEGDMSFLRRLSKRHDATMTVKDGNLIFTAIGKGTASGKEIPFLFIQRVDGDSHSYHVSERENYNGVRAQYKGSGRKKHMSVIVGGENSTGMKVLPEIYPNEAAARAAATAEFNRTQRSQATFDYTLAAGVPDAIPERPVFVEGFKPEINKQAWLIRSAHHELSESGYTTQLMMEQADDPTTQKHRENFQRPK
jgi:phage protein D